VKLGKDYLFETPVIISPERAKRPHQYSYEEPPPSAEELKNCPFCPGNEHLTPSEHLRIEDSYGNWQVRVFPNRFKIWKVHDVIVDTPEHLKDWDEFDLLPLFEAIKRRVKQIYQMHSEVKWISLFRNYGKLAGASIRHSHLQLIALDFVPERIKKLEEKLSGEKCAICREEWKEELLVKEGRHFRLLFVQGTQPYELELHLKTHKPSLEFLEKEELKEACLFLRGVIKAFKKFFPSYNVLFFLAPKGKDFHFFVRLFPRLTFYAGFEFESGIVVNPLDPEKAFEFLGEEILSALRFFGF
jgi:UDPglucose--hexose-1-phosphate uridylyltransferase